MAKRTSTSDSADAAAPDAEAQLLRAGLDTLTFGFAIFDDAMKLVASKAAVAASIRICRFIFKSPPVLLSSKIAGQIGRMLGLKGPRVVRKTVK